MSSSDTKFTLPFIAHLQQIVGIEQAQLERAGTAVADTTAAVAEAERILQEALAGQRVALGEQRVATERYEAALATVQAAESYAAELGLTTAPQTDADAPQADTAEPGADAPPPQGPTPSGTLAHLIVDVLEPGRDTTVPEIYEKVWALRPEVANNAVRAALSQLHKIGRVESVRRGVYRLLKLAEDHTTDR